MRSGSQPERYYNDFLEQLRAHGLEAGTLARRLDWSDPEKYGDDL